MIIEDKEIKVTGRIIKLAELKEDWDEDIEDPEVFLKKLKTSGIKADIFTFMQRLPESRPKYSYPMKWDNCAAIPIKGYEYWLKKQLCKNSRKKIGLAQRKGVELRLCEYNEELVKGILAIYHESPIKQGKPNRQYRTDYETCWILNATFVNRAIFIGAFFDKDLIGYIKLVNAGKYMRTMGILSKIAHNDKAPMNLLIAKAVEICAEKKIPYLTYARFEYGKRGSETLKEFKRHLGFENIVLPRYYLPLSNWGKLIMLFNLHNNFFDLLPERWIRILLNLRSNWYSWMYSKY